MSRALPLTPGRAADRIKARRALIFEWLRQYPIDATASQFRIDVGRVMAIVRSARGRTEKRIARQVRKRGEMAGRGRWV